MPFFILLLLQPLVQFVYLAASRVVSAVIAIGPLQPIANGLLGWLKLLGKLPRRSAVSSQFEDSISEFFRIWWTNSWHIYPWLAQKQRNVHTTGSGPALKSWDDALEAIVWDGAKGATKDPNTRRSKPPFQQPSYSPELLSAERIFQYLRARIEGTAHGELDLKKEAVESELRKLAARPEKVQSLTCWGWIEKALTQLSEKQATLR